MKFILVIFFAYSTMLSMSCWSRTANTTVEKRKAPVVRLNSMSRQAPKPIVVKPTVSKSTVAKPVTVIKKPSAIKPSNTASKVPQKSVAQKPVTQKTVTQEPKNQKPASQKPMTQKTTAKKPVAKSTSTVTPPVSSSVPPSGKSRIHWGWPTSGPILRHFHQGEKVKGIDIAGKAGSLVKSAAKGTIVYSGSALKGYGNLIIIKHNEEFLTAYAHNQELMVKEGDKVEFGQPIAKMGKTDSDRVKLHFEIRYKGKPVDPMKLLPKKS